MLIKLAQKGTDRSSESVGSDSHQSSVNGEEVSVAFQATGVRQDSGSGPDPDY